MSTAEILKTQLSRRSFLTAAILIPSIPTLLAGCTEETSKKIDRGKQKLNDELDKLPDSTIKTLLFSRVKPFFGPNPPTSINYDGLEIKISNPTIVLKTVNNNRVTGLFTPRDSSFATIEPLYPTKATSIKLPYFGLVLDSEKAMIPAENLAEDGTTLLDIDFPANQALYEGLVPVITITTPDPSVIKAESRQRYKNFERFIYIKEACSFLLVDLLIGETIKKMHSLGLNTTLETKAQNGTKRQTEAVTQSLTLVIGTYGRLMAAIDIAGYLLTFKAIAGTDIDDPNNMDAGLVKVRPSMQTVDLKTSPEGILYKSFYWALTTPEANKQLTHAGNLNNIP